MTTPPSIVWLTLESIRADHTTVGNYYRDTTPKISAIAKSEGGTSFNQAFSNGIWTRSATASILTGSYPISHKTGIDGEPLPESVRTVPEILKNVGYETTCFSDNPHLSTATGLDRGFDDFRWVEKSNIHKTAGVYNLIKYLIQLPVHGGGYTRERQKHSLSYLVSKGVKRKLRSANNPQFVYAHLGDTHHPYCPPNSVIDRFLNDTSLGAKEAREISIEMSANIMQHIANGCDFSDREWLAIKAMYDSSIAYIDQCIGSIYDFLETRDRDYILVIVGDHGELFGEEGMLAHKLVTHDAVCHIPAVVSGDTAVTGHDGELIQPLDIARTICGEVGADTETLQGIDLRNSERDVAIIERGWPRARRNLEKLSDIDPSFDHEAYQPGKLTALRSSEFKLESWGDGIALYELPDESTDISEQKPEKVEAFINHLENFRSEYEQRRSDQETESGFSEKIEERLSDLGYLTRDE